MTPSELKSARHALGLSAEGFAKLMHVASGRTVRRWESGDQDIPGLVAAVTTGLIESPAVRAYFGVELAPKAQFPHKERSGRDGSQAAIWAYLRMLPSGERWTADDISTGAGVPISTVHYYVRALTRAGISELVEAPTHYQGGATPGRWRLTRSIGPMPAVVTEVGGEQAAFDPNAPADLQPLSPPA